MKRNNWKKMMLLMAGCWLSALSFTAAQETEQTLSAGEVTIENATSLECEKLMIKAASEDEWMANLAEDTSFTPEEGAAYDLKLESKTGDTEIFYNLILSELSALKLCEREDGALYVVYSGKDAEEETDTLRYAVAPRETAQTCYAKVRLNVREWPDTASNVLRTLSIGEEITVCGESEVWPESVVAEGETETELSGEGESLETESWYLVRNDEGYGYVFAEYVTDDKEEADRLIAEEQARLQAEAEARAWAAAQAQAAAEAEAQAQAAADAQAKETAQADQKKEKKKKDEKTVVKKEKVPGCDDPDHGMLYITYSDGSVEAQEY